MSKSFSWLDFSISEWYNHHMKKIIPILFLPAAMVLAGGCALNESSNVSFGSIMKSTNGGSEWESKVKIDEKKNIGRSNILSMAIDSLRGDIIYVGTEKDGLFISENGAETWKKMNFPVGKIYGLAVDSVRPETVYASGVWQNRGKIYKSDDKGENWKEIYSEPANGTLILSLAVNKENPSVIYAGTSEGMVLLTIDGGNSWKSPYKASGAVISVAFDSKNASVAYFGVFNRGVLVTKNNGDKFEDVTEKLEKNGLNLKAYSLIVDPKYSGIFYVGSGKGIVKVVEYGEKAEELKILEVSKKFPIRGIAINPFDSNEIIYNSAQALYKSTDGGNSWSTFQLQGDRVAGTIKYSPIDSRMVYMGLREIK